MNQTANQLDPYLDNENDSLSLSAVIYVLLNQSYFALVRFLNRLIGWKMQQSDPRVGTVQK